MLLVGDIGGTKANLILVQQDADPHRPDHAARLDARAFPSLEALLASFLASAGHPMVQAACIGVPAPVINGHIAPANLPWQADESAVAAALHIPHVRFLNDLVATAFGIPELRADEVEVLVPGQPQAGAPIAVVAPGTGLGFAVVLPGPADEEGRPTFTALPSETGHADFPPRGARQRVLAAFLDRGEHGQVGLEQVCSGKGIPNLWRFLGTDPGGNLGDTQDIAAALAAAADRGEDLTPRIVAAAADPANGRCAGAVDLFAVILGQTAGNAALTHMALGGVYLAGGMPPRVLPALRAPAVATAFRANPRLAPVLAGIPLSVVLNDRCAVLGAAAVARRLLVG